MDDFDSDWRRLIAAARRVPAAEPLTLDVERILAQRPRPAPAPLRIGWFPPGLAVAAGVLLLLAPLLGLDPRGTAVQAAEYLADLPRQVPAAPAIPPPDAVLPPPAHDLLQPLKAYFP